MKTLAIALLALLACLLALGLLQPRKGERALEGIPRGIDPAFQLRIVMPPAARALFGILPNWVEDRLEKVGATPRELHFDHRGPGAAATAVAAGRLELRNAAGWEVHLEADGEGKITSATWVTFPIHLGERDVVLRCWPAESPVGRLDTRPVGTNQLGGRFRLELEKCKNTVSGKNTDWPPSALEVSGSFAGLPLGRP